VLIFCVRVDPGVSWEFQQTETARESTTGQPVVGSMLRRSAMFQVDAEIQASCNFSLRTSNPAFEFVWTRIVRQENAAGLPLPKVIVPVDEIRNGKPDPEGLLRAAESGGD